MSKFDLFFNTCQSLQDLEDGTEEFSSTLAILADSVLNQLKPSPINFGRLKAKFDSSLWDIILLIFANSELYDLLDEVHAAWKSYFIPNDPTSSGHKEAQMEAMLKQLTKALRTDLPLPTFSRGTRVLSFIEDYEFISREKGFTDAEMLSHLKGCFSSFKLGNQKLLNQIRLKGQFNSWNEARSWLIEVFSETQPAKSFMTKFMTVDRRDSKDGLEQYIVALDDMFLGYSKHLKTTVSDSEKIERFLWGLQSPSAEKSIRAKQFPNYDDMLKFCRENWNPSQGQVSSNREKRKHKSENFSTRKSRRTSDYSKKPLKFFIDNKGCSLHKTLNHSWHDCKERARVMNVNNLIAESGNGEGRN